MSDERISEWKKCKKEDEDRQRTGAVEERLLYYANFYDLDTILGKQWDKFAGAFGKKKNFMPLLDQLATLRNPDAHRRELLPHQKHLILGISGEIRTMIVRYRSKREMDGQIFPRIESVQDNLGHALRGGESSKHLYTNKIHYPGDLLEITISATDPEGAPLQYAAVFGIMDRVWTEANQFCHTILERDILIIFTVYCYIKNKKPYHAYHSWDDYLELHYLVHPPRK